MEEEFGLPMGGTMIADLAHLPAPAQPAQPPQPITATEAVTQLSKYTRGEPITETSQPGLAAAPSTTEQSPTRSWLDYFKSAVNSIPESKDFIPQVDGRTPAGAKSTEFIYDSTVGTLKSGLQSAIAVYEARQKGEIDYKNLANLGFATASFIPIAGPEMRAVEAMRTGAAKLGKVASSIVGGSKAELSDLAGWAERNVSKAESMAATGATEQEIYRATSLSRDERGNFQFEISDKEMGMNPKFAENFSNTIGVLQKQAPGTAKQVEGKFSDFFQHPGLETIHPELRNAPVTFRMSSDAGRITAHVDEKNLGFHFDVPAHVPEGVGGKVEETLKGVVTHELQHYVDMRAAEAGMFRSFGTNPEEARKFANAAVQDLTAGSGEVKSRVQRIFQALDEQYAANPELSAKYLDTSKSHAAYAHEAGEVRARVTGRSTEMTMEERLNTHPNLRADVKPEHQISFGQMTSEFQSFRSMVAKDRAEEIARANPVFGKRGQ